MTIRCGCDAEGDDIVFGQLHRCGEVRCDRHGLSGCWPCMQYYSTEPVERPYETTLDESERRGD